MRYEAINLKSEMNFEISVIGFDRGSDFLAYISLHKQDMCTTVFQKRICNRLSK